MRDPCLKMIVVRKLIKLHVTYLMYRTWGPSPPQATSWSKEAEQANCGEENVEVVVVVSKTGIDEILDLEKISRGNGPFFSISSWRIEFSFLEMLSNVKILKKKFSFSSRNSRFWKKFSFTSRKNEILQTDSLSLLDSSLNVFSNSREKSYFALWVDFDHQCFAERESILKRQFCVVEQYSDFSLQKHFMETTTTKSHLWEYFEWLPSGKGICKTCKNEIVDWLGWRVRTRGGGEEIDFFYCIWYWLQ